MRTWEIPISKGPNSGGRICPEHTLASRIWRGHCLVKHTSKAAPSQRTSWRICAHGSRISPRNWSLPPSLAHSLTLQQYLRVPCSVTSAMDLLACSTLVGVLHVEPISPQ